MPTEITTPVGRIVWGHPARAIAKTKQNSREPLLGADGQPRMQRAYGLAIPKQAFIDHVWPAMAAEAASGYPQGVPPAFSWKYVDGDGIDREGKPYNQREGYAGNFVLAISTELQTAPPIYKFNGAGYDQLPADAIKTGDWGVAGLNLVVNIPTDRTHTPGLYVNPVLFEFVGYGTEIVTVGKVDPMAMLQGRQHQLPAGASATPMQTPGAPGYPTPQPAQQPQPGYPTPQPAQQPQPGYPAPQGMPMQSPTPQPGYPAPQQPQGVPGGQLPPPAHGFVPGAPQPAQQPQPGYPAPQGMQPGYPAPQQPQPGYPAPQGMPGQMPPR